MATITTHAAVARAPHQGWELTDLQLDDPKEHEVRIKFAASGLCHSDDHITAGDAPVRFPVVGGHEGAGIVESIGPNVNRVKVGDRVVCSYIPACGACRPCSTGHQNMCVKGLNAGSGMFLDGTFRFHKDGEDFGGFCSLGTFSQYAVVSEWAVVPLADDIPFEIASLVGCGVPTGWGSAVYAAGVKPGDTAVIFGAGGVGSNAVQGARYAGAKNVVVIDPVEFKRESAMNFGATHTFADAKEAHEFVNATTWGQLADHAILTPGVVTEEMVMQAVMMTGKGGKVTITGVGALKEKAVHVPAGLLIGYQRQIRGALFGDCNPLYDIPKLLGLYRSGDLKLDELVTRTYALDDVNQAYQDLADGKNIRGVIVHDI
ncbi:NDMA-dependent alcohol dehydrogenase [Microbacterium sp. zg.B48]|uniref:NDMA-dependent alcohol dehydrogenase n=1 Tax=unclassified Microbacterium TaxID=2609290 RepID=UPI00214C510A|nr:MULTISPECIES: NDMA-dependent alcohol dehydrogenase [unclassified Microbacterium]MCR2765069.1 NDMA-dependent alcohol dehydrogenase [Microbacterium sp. zg.B48]MCR2811248.1 NDMA-dependent alcohol dehydrogenase [Microbacterium sp. zg.B185]WIM19847.1 NDMA-dependent alcohol dehydrogenase [Microbacterium sp. zg-B185]